MEQHLAISGPRRRRAIGLAAVTILLGVVVHVQAAERIDSTATEQLRKMSTFLARQKQFSFEASTTTQIVLKTGERVDLDLTSQVTVQRPNMLRSERRGSSNASLYYDGKQIAFYGKADNAYATVAAPPALDQAIDFARAELGLDAPGADLLYSNPYAILMEDVIGGTYVGKSLVRDVPCHHLVFRGHETDWQIWIGEGAQPLPMRMVIVSKKVKGEPEYRVELSQWNLNPKLDASVFRFTPPQGAKHVEFTKPAPESESGAAAR